MPIIKKKSSVLLLASLLPCVRGRYQPEYPLAKSVWLRVGGRAAVLYKPADIEDLCTFLKQKPAEVSYTLIGAGSNVLIRDGGIDGVVIRLDRGFSDITVQEDRLIVGAGALDRNVALTAAEAGLGGLEFLIGIPGRLGGAVVMNAGAYGREIKDILIECIVVDPAGKQHILTPADLGFSYRHSSLPAGWIVVRATLLGVPTPKEDIMTRIQEILKAREDTQPIRARTGGSTFKNPISFPQKKAWELIDEAGCRGWTRGDAMISEKHCNFLINKGSATAKDLESLADDVQRKVLDCTGVQLEWEIRKLGTSDEKKERSHDARSSAAPT